MHIKLTYFDHRPAAMRTVATPVTLMLGTTTLTPVDRLPLAPANEGFILAYDLSPALLHANGTDLTISTPTWNPAAAGVSNRDEPLGIFINNLEVWADGVPMTAAAAVILPPVPSTPRNVWNWANYPSDPHLLDWWPVILHDAGMPRGITAGMATGLIAVIALALGGGLFCFRSTRCPRSPTGGIANHSP